MSKDCSRAMTRKSWGVPLGRVRECRDAAGFTSRYLSLRLPLSGASVQGARMSIWSRITAAIQALAKGEPLAAVFEHLRTPPERSVGFTIAVIALGAKMAKADGRVTRDEVTAFRQVFDIPKGEEAHAARLFNLARQDVAGFEEYAWRGRRNRTDGLHFCF